MSSSNLFKWSGLAALVGGLLLVVSDVLNAIFFPGEQGGDVMTTGSWLFVQYLVLVALVLITLGLVGLYARQAKQAGTLGLIAFLVAVSGTMMAFGLLWGEPFLGPMLAEEAPSVLAIEPSGVALAGSILALLLFALGWFLFGLTSLRARILSRGAAVLLMAGSVLFLVLALLELPLWSVVLGAAVAWMGYALWSSAAIEPKLISKAAT
jgi:hypothetical protein